MDSRWIEKFELSPGKWVFVPSAQGRAFGDFLLSEINRKWKTPDYYYHFRNGGHVAAVRKHLDSVCYTKIDLSRFFYHISLSRVTRNLKCYFEYQTAREYARKSTVLLPGYKQKCLPYGFIQSMALASLAFRNSAIGTYLETVNNSKDVTVSLYVDDILLSSRSRTALMVASETAKFKIEKSGFQISAEKSIYCQSKIDIFNISLQHKKMKVSDEKFEEFVYRSKHATEKQIKGIYSYIKSINSLQGAEYLSRSKTMFNLS